MKYRVKVEVEYLIFLAERLNLKDILEHENVLRGICDLSESHFETIKEWESRINHDVKAVEMFLRDIYAFVLKPESLEYIHFGLTSQDVTNTAFPLAIKDAFHKVIEVNLVKVLNTLQRRAFEWENIPMLAHTHGQPATPTTLEKEMTVFLKRVTSQIKLLFKVPFSAKFGGATGNFNAHHIAYPNINWHNFAFEFIKKLGLERTVPTTQIEPYDNLAAFCHTLMRINTVWIDFCRDIWQYISMGYFKLKRNENQVGSSTMPHKVNPIDFENAEGNLGMANAIFQHLANKLPISRLQRDLTDSTVIRNIGTAFAHTLLSYKNIVKGIDKLEVNQQRINEDLENNWVVLTEAVQTILRREGVPNGYDLVKEFTMNNEIVTRDVLHEFINTLQIKEEAKDELKKLTPSTYIGH
jgi:adenylosuccinate lyase